jgi:hypothetical protein
LPTFLAWEPLGDALPLAEAPDAEEAADLPLEEVAMLGKKRGMKG